MEKTSAQRAYYAFMKRAQGAVAPAPQSGPDNFTPPKLEAQRAAQSVAPKPTGDIYARTQVKKPSGLFENPTVPRLPPREPDQSAARAQNFAMNQENSRINARDLDSIQPYYNSNESNRILGIEDPNMGNYPLPMEFPGGYRDPDRVKPNLRFAPAETKGDGIWRRDREGLLR